MRQYEAADVVASLAKETIIPKWHPECSKLSIAYVFTDDIGVSKGRVTMAKVKKTTALEAHLTGLDAILVVDRVIWNRLAESQQVALIDHEFCHVGVNDEGALFLVGHDLEEFAAVVNRHGAWMDDIARFNQAQMDLFQPAEVAR